MYLSELTVEHFRNLSRFCIELSASLTLISGDNAAGKSNLLEAVSYLVSGRSFRTSKNDLLVAHEATKFTLFGRFSDSKKLGVQYNKVDKTRKIKINGETSRTLSSLASLYPVQLLSPESYHLIDSGPLGRRKYLDWLLFHVEPEYQKEWVGFNQLLSQRNAFLKNSKGRVSSSEMGTWDLAYQQSANKIDRFRKKLSDQLLPIINDLLKMVGFKYASNFNGSYYSGYTGDLLVKLKESIGKDLIMGATQFGPHRADLYLKIDRDFAKNWLSRGQKKVLINCLYLAQTVLLKKITNKDSLFIVDDFTSELDQFNQQTLLHLLKEQKNVQIILSCLNTELLKPLIKRYNNINMFHVEQGEVKLRVIG